MTQAARLLQQLTDASLRITDAGSSLDDLRREIAASARTLLGVEGAAVILVDDDRPAAGPGRAVPLLGRHGAPVGVLHLSEVGDHELGEVERLLLTELARIAGAALEDARTRAPHAARIDELTRTVHFAEMFIGVLGHDLRNPLNAVMVAAQFLNSRFAPQDEQLARSVGRILSSGDRMARMIGQMLDLTRLRLGNGLELDRRTIAVDELCRRVMPELDALSPGRLRLHVVGNAAGAWDATRLEQVISNVAGNALQHGRADAEVLLFVDGRHDDHLTLTVHNADPIPPDVLPEIFQPFRSKRRKSRGLGLGLYIAQEIILAHQGRIEVDSTETDGTTFRITLPRRFSSPTGRTVALS